MEVIGYKQERQTKREREIGRRKERKEKRAKRTSMGSKEKERNEVKSKSALPQLPNSASFYA